MPKELTLKQIEGHGVLELVELALTQQQLYPLTGCTTDHDLTEELGPFTDVERKVASFIQLLGEVAVTEGGIDPTADDQEYYEAIYQSSIGNQIEALYAYLVISIQIRKGLEVNTKQEITWDAEGTIYQLLIPQHMTC